MLLHRFCCRHAWQRFGGETVLWSVSFPGLNLSLVAFVKVMDLYSGSGLTFTLFMYVWWVGRSTFMLSKLDAI